MHIVWLMIRRFHESLLLFRLLVLEYIFITLEHLTTEDLSHLKQLLFKHLFKSRLKLRLNLFNNFFIHFNNVRMFVNAYVMYKNKYEQYNYPYLAICKIAYIQLDD